MSNTPNDGTPKFDWPGIERQLVEGDQGAWAKAMSFMYPKLLKSANFQLDCAADAEDAVNDGILMAYEQRRKQQIYNWPCFFFKGVWFAVQKIRRRRNRDATLASEAASLVEDSGDDPATAAERRANSAAVHSMLGRLRREQREVIYLRHFEQMKWQKIGDCLGIPVPTAVSRYRAGLKRLREMAGEAFPDILAPGS